MRLKKSLFFVSLVLGLIVLAQISLASFELGNYSIIKSYSPNENLKGWINISLQDEPADSVLTLNSEGNLSLLDFLEDINYADFTCFPEDCVENYKTSSGGTIKSFSLFPGQEKILAFKVTGNINSITSLSFNISVGNSEVCINPLKIDLLDDGNYEWSSKKYVDKYACTYEGGFGCFNSGESSSEVLIDQTPYCEKIGLVESGKFSLGAWIRKGTTVWSNDLLTMRLYDLEGNDLPSCNLPEPSTEGGEINCTIDYYNDKTQDYYVCVKASQDTDYKIRTEDTSPCGFYAEPNEETENHDYYIFAKAARFGNIGSFLFNQQEWETQGNSEEYLKDYIDNYVAEIYNKNCTNGCSIPIRFKAYQQVSINISSISLGYSTGGGSQTPENKIYDAEKEPAQINSEFLILNLDNVGFKVPADYGNHTVTLSLGENEIFSDKINVVKSSSIKGVYPLSVAAAVPTTFYASIESANKTITEYNWSFGVGESLTTAENKVKFTYPDIGSYTLTLSITDENGNTAQKSFSVTTSSPEEVANKTIFNYKNKIENMKNNLTSISTWYKKFVEDSIGTSDLESTLTSIEQDYRDAQVTSDYVSIMEKLVAMKVPDKIIINRGNINKFADSSDIDVASLSDLGAGDIKEGEESSYQDSIASWFNTNIEANLEYETISLLYDTEIKNNISIFNLQIKPKKDVRNGYLVFEADLMSAQWKEDYKQEDVNGKTGIVLSDLKKDEERDIEFASVYIDPIELIVYLSAKLNEVGVVKEGTCNYNNVCDADEDYKNCPADCKPWGRVVLWISVLLLVALIIYIILQHWYKVNYEKSLFKNRNDLFNLVTFINNAKSRGLGETEIRAKLKQAGWKGEQINYAVKKAKGKFVGMKELKIFEKLFKKKLETN